MRGYNEVNYCIYIKKDEGYYKFAKESIINNDMNFEECGVPINNEKIYNIFFMLFPILKEIPRENIMIQRAWESWHPSDITPENEYNELLLH